MSLILASSVIITAPATVDGRGEVATLNDDTATTTYVGRILGGTGFGGPAVRTAMENRAEAHGAQFGNFYYAHRAFTLSVLLARKSSWAGSDSNFNKLCRAFDAMIQDGTIQFVDTDAITKLLRFRRETSPSDPDEQGRVTLGGVCEDPRIYSSALLTSASPVTNLGNAGSPPTFTFTPTGGDVVITNTTSGMGTPDVTIKVGTGFVEVGGGLVTVNFADRTISQGGVEKPQAELWPDSLWWELVPNANTWTVTNASGVTLIARSAWQSA